MKPTFSSSDKLKITLVSIFLAALLVLLGFLIGLMLRQSGFRLSTLVSLARATLNFPGTPSAPTILVPTQDCSPPTLTLDATTLQIENMSRAADGSLNLPLGTSGLAYWIEGTNTNYIFVLPPLPENLAVMSTITVESPVTVTWSNCNSSTYTVSVPQQGSWNDSTLTDQSKEGITVFFQTDASGAGFVFTGGLSEQAITSFDTPAANEVQAEIGLLETTASEEGKTLRISISIQNYGNAALAVSIRDLSLTQPDGTSLALENSQPRLPETINVGDTKTFELTFPRPTSPTATLRIFNVEFDIGEY
jgi:hypothetical protein